MGVWKTKSVGNKSAAFPIKLRYDWRMVTSATPAISPISKMNRKVWICLISLVIKYIYDYLPESLAKTHNFTSRQIILKSKFAILWPTSSMAINAMNSNNDSLLFCLRMRSPIAEFWLFALTSEDVSSVFEISDRSKQIKFQGCI